MADSPYSTRFRIVAAVVVAFAALVFTLAYFRFQDGTEDPIVQSGDAADFVEDLIPRRSDQVPQQSSVGIDLIPSWTGTLEVNGTEVPADELTVTDELGLIQFAPGPGRAVEQLQTGTNTVRAIVWPRSESRETAAETVTWTFEVV
jgi:hypothetical protein